MKRRSISLIVVMALLPFATLARAADQYAVTYERNVAVKMRDNVTLRSTKRARPYLLRRGLPLRDGRSACNFFKYLTISSEGRPARRCSGVSS